MGEDKIQETMANTVHDIWAHWMEYLYSVSTYNDDGSITIPADKVTRWAEQMKTNYYWLSEKEKDSDRDQVEKIRRDLIVAGFSIIG